MSFESHKALCNLPGFPDGSVVKNLPANAGDVRDTGSVPGLGRSPGGGYGNPLQYSCLDRGAWQATVSETRLKWLSIAQHDLWIAVVIHFWIIIVWVNGGSTVSIPQALLVGSPIYFHNAPHLPLLQYSLDGILIAQVFISFPTGV